MLGNLFICSSDQKDLKKPIAFIYSYTGDNHPGVVAEDLRRVVLEYNGSVKFLSPHIPQMITAPCSIYRLTASDVFRIDYSGDATLSYFEEHSSADSYCKAILDEDHIFDKSCEGAESVYDWADNLVTKTRQIVGLSYAFKNFDSADLSVLKKIAQEDWKSLPGYNRDLYSSIQTMKESDKRYQLNTLDHQKVAFLKNLLSKNGHAYLGEKLLDDGEAVQHHRFCDVAKPTKQDKKTYSDVLKLVVDNCFRARNDDLSQDEMNIYMLIHEMRIAFLNAEGGIVARDVTNKRQLEICFRHLLIEFALFYFLVRDYKAIIYTGAHAEILFAASEFWGKELYGEGFDAKRFLIRKEALLPDTLYAEIKERDNVERVSIENQNKKVHELKTKLKRGEKKHGHQKDDPRLDLVSIQRDSEKAERLLQAMKLHYGPRKTQLEDIEDLLSVYGEADADGDYAEGKRRLSKVELKKVYEIRHSMCLRRGLPPSPVFELDKALSQASDMYPPQRVRSSLQELSDDQLTAVYKALLAYEVVKLSASSSSLFGYSEIQQQQETRSDGVLALLSAETGEEPKSSQHTSLV